MKTLRLGNSIKATAIGVVAVLLFAIAVVTTVSLKPTSAQSTTPVAELNRLAITKDRNLWTSTYDTLRRTSSYSWMDWSADGCSVDFEVNVVTGSRSNLFNTACLRHDLAWRTLAVIDDGDGDVWNQRNRLAADRKFLSDLEDICEDTYPV